MVGDWMTRRAVNDGYFRNLQEQHIETFSYRKRLIEWEKITEFFKTGRMMIKTWE